MCAFLCDSVTVCVHTLTSSIMTPQLSGVVTYTVLTLSLSLSLCITIHLSVSPAPPSPHPYSLLTPVQCTFLLWSHLLNLTLPSFLAFFVIFSICHLAQQGLFSHPIFLVFFFFTPLHFRAEILQSFTRLLDSSLPDFLLCSTLPCFTGLWRMPLERSPLLSSFLHSFFYTVEPAIFCLYCWPVPQRSG